MKRQLLLSLAAILLALPTLARDFTYTYEGQTITYTVIDEDAKTVKTKDGGRREGGDNTPGNSVSGDLILPSEVYDGDTKYILTEIGIHAFFLCDSLTDVTIPNSVTIIGSYAFSNCWGLTSVTIPNSVTEIGNTAFNYCSSLTSVNIPNSVTKIGDWAFHECSGLTSVYIPNSVTEIGEYAFYRCSNLTSVTYLAEDPMTFSGNIVRDYTYQKATLNYLESAEEKITITYPWSRFINRIGRDADWKEEGAIAEVQATDGGATAIYDMRGVKVGTSTEGLPKGIYIIREGNKTRKFAI